VLVAAEPARHAAIRAALGRLREVPMHFAGHGTQILLMER
jgi:hypothetical protein